jgi:hypothetical protein
MIAQEESNPDTHNLATAWEPDPKTGNRKLAMARHPQFSNRLTRALAPLAVPTNCGCLCLGSSTKRREGQGCDRDDQGGYKRPASNPLKA